MRFFFSLSIFLFMIVKGFDTSHSELMVRLEYYSHYYEIDGSLMENLYKFFFLQSSCNMITMIQFVVEHKMVIVSYTREKDWKKTDKQTYQFAWLVPTHMKQVTYETNQEVDALWDMSRFVQCPFQLTNKQTSTHGQFNTAN